MKSQIHWGLTFAVLAAVAPNAASITQAQEGAARLDTSEAIEITADTLEVNQEQQIAVFSGNVAATQGEILLSADQLVVHYAAANSDEVQAISTIDAEGNVFFATNFETAQGNTGTYDVENSKITLTGNVVLTRGDNVLRGTRLVLNLLDGKSRVDGGNAEDGGRVRGLFVPNNPAN